VPLLKQNKRVRTLQVARVIKSRLKSAFTTEQTNVLQGTYSFRAVQYIFLEPIKKQNSLEIGSARAHFLNIDKWFSLPMDFTQPFF
jgi:hypothetical protein